MGRWLRRSRAAARAFKRRTRARRPLRRRSRTRGTALVKRALRSLVPLSYYDQLGTGSYNLSDGWDWAATNAALMPFSGMPTAGTTAFATINQQQVVRSNRFQVYSIDFNCSTVLTLGSGTPPVQLPLKFKILVLGTHHPTGGTSTPLSALGPLDYASTWTRSGTLTSYKSSLSQENMWKVLHVYEKEMHRDFSSAAGTGPGNLLYDQHRFRVKFPKPWLVELVPNVGAAIANSEVAKGQIWFVAIINSPTDPAAPTTRQMINPTFRVSFRNQS